MRSPANLRWIVGFVGAGLVFCAVTYPALGSSFSADDYVLLRYSTAVSLEDSFRFFLTDWGGGRGEGGYYRPVVNVSLAADHALFRPWPPGFRAVKGCLD